MAAKPTPRKDELSLRGFAMAYPGAHEDFPWGERAIKVKGKVFVFMSNREKTLSLSMKLPQSKGEAIHGYDFTEPTHYGMGKHGWVTSTFPPGKKVPLEVMRDWINESYRAVAPAKLVKEFDTALEKPAQKTAARTAGKKAPPKKSKAAAKRRS